MAKHKHEMGDFSTSGPLEALSGQPRVSSVGTAGPRCIVCLHHLSVKVQRMSDDL